jgi:hypothetical protein
MFGIGARLGTLAIAAALLFAARRVHRSAGKRTKFTKPAGVVLAFLSGCAFLVTFVGGWMSGLAAGGFAVAGLIVCTVVIAVDWFADNKPDGAAFWAAFFLATFVVLGASQIPQATGQVGDGLSKVGEQMTQVTSTPQPAPAHPVRK